ncbi:MAG: acetate/propionate family kinase [Cyanobacteria bacterium SZAS LIN-3]|nr:acetate/propionate family kinase [Cyanobacteria bacterium SZAS LIN-3]MBS2008986.1 acetate/propionate family kinase [Cyanobacteria bacterium SZAS TMP-1]
MAILVINSGSSSLKLSLFEKELASEEPLWSKKIEGSGLDSLASTIAELTKDEGGLVREIETVGHRIVHGGTRYSTSVVIDDSVIANLKALIELAPAHEAANIRAVEEARQALPRATHVAVFDTSYHFDMPLASQIYAVPWSWYEERGIRRFGFHGINHKYCVETVSKHLDHSKKPAQKIITCHLGSGGSLCASLNGRSIMTTMGYTPLEGLVMRTRSGSIDPGLLLLLLQNNRYSVDELSQILNQESGLKGISGLTGDMRQLEDAVAAGHVRAKLAFDIYIQNLAASVASLLPVLGGLDALVFTGGIGEHSAAVREEVCTRLSFLGLAIDKNKNNPAATPRVRSNQVNCISAADSAIETYVIAAAEELSIARECRRLTAAS